jgi:predicted PurR-regulated permease PerM
MKKMPSFVSATMIGAALIGAPVLAPVVTPAFAQGTPQAVDLVKVDMHIVSTGYRSSKIVGSTVVNEANETVGKVDDLIVTSENKVPFAILSVGGILGVGTHLVAVPFTSLKMEKDKVELPGATKEALKDLPEFRYAS